MVLDLALRARVQGLADRVARRRCRRRPRTHPRRAGPPGPVRPDGHRPRAASSTWSATWRSTCPPPHELEVPSREVHLPLSWDDPAIRESIDRYMAGVRDDAPWCPSNIEFIRRINGLDSVDEVERTVFDATYVVLGLGDVYLGAPLATPVDPRHRLVTTKYNPARTWTAQNSVGHRRLLPLHLRAGGSRRLPAGRPHRPDLEPLLRSGPRSSRASRGCCGSSTASAGIR